MEKEACVKRRRYDGEPRATGSSDPGLLQLNAGGKVGSSVGPEVCLRSSALGRALLFGVRGAGRALKAAEGRPAGSSGQLASGALGPHEPAGQLSRLGEAVSAGGRLKLKRRRLQEAPGMEQPCSQGTLDALAACCEVEVASAIAAWPRGPR